MASIAETQPQKLIVEFTDEEHEKPCKWCSKVALWNVVIADIGCGHPHYLCQFHSDECRQYEVWQCSTCRMEGWVLEWKRI